jgi:hypothetical protein
MITDEKIRQQTACEAAQLLNEAVRQLTAPSLILDLMKPWMEEDQPNFLRIAAVRNVCILSIVVNLYRVMEIREHFLVDFLFTEENLRDLGFPSIEKFFGGAAKVRRLEVLRHQFAGHAMGRWAANDQPGRLIPAKLLGQALRETGLTELPDFAERLREEVAAQLESFVRELNRLFPAVSKFIREDYPLELENGQLGR